MKKNEKTAQWLAIACLLASAFAGCRKVESYDKPLTPVKVQAVEQRVISSEGARYSANIQPDSQLDLAFKIGGYIEQILQVSGRSVQGGDWVTKGTVLARIRDTEFDARIKQARARLSEAQAAELQVKSQLAEAHAGQNSTKIELERVTRLFEAESLIKPDYEAVKTKFEMGQAKIESIKAQLAMTQAIADGARAQIEEIENARRDVELKAPMDGLVLKRNVEIGSLVAPGAPAFTLADTNSVKVAFGMPDVETPNLKPGSSLTVTTEAMRGIEFRGRLDRLSPSADPKTRVFDVEVKIPNPRRRLKVGMVVLLEVAGERMPEPVTVVPLPALLQIKEKDAGYAVFVVEEQSGKQLARLRRVQIGRTLGNMIAVASGVKTGEQVIVSGATMVTDSEQVRVVP
jgi:multidrug efflux system membrane fusion protein